mmetsp:Transcript_63177/g.150936  ORF Transcript_63177/g.150936 Transcript_63177/m.150936 type:complete len:149 (+) Transcript_63177:1266-1712(+)
MLSTDRLPFGFRSSCASDSAGGLSVSRVLANGDCGLGDIGGESLMLSDSAHTPGRGPELCEAPEATLLRRSLPAMELDTTGASAWQPLISATSSSRSRSKSSAPSSSLGSTGLQAGSSELLRSHLAEEGLAEEGLPEEGLAEEGLAEE